MAGGEHHHESPSLASTSAAAEDEESEEGEEEEESEEERENRELEQEISEMGRRILDHRRTLPDRLLETLTSSLVAHRPVLPPPPAAPPCGSGSGTQEQSELVEEASLTAADQETLKKVRIFKAKIASNIAAMPVVLKRLNDCIAMVENVDGYNVNVDPVFKRIRKH